MVTSRLDGDIDWLTIVKKSPEDYGYVKFIETVDTVIMGRETYDKVLSFNMGFPHKGRKCYVVSRTRTGADGDVEYYSGNLEELIAELKVRDGKNVFIDGGAEVVNQLLKSKMIDEFIFSIIPIFLGSGIRLFQEGRSEQQLKFKSMFSFETGLVQLWYQTNVVRNTT